MIWSILTQSFTFLSECVSHSIAHQNVGCHRKLVDIVRGDVGFAPRDLDRSLMSRQRLLQSGPKCDMCASFRALCELVLARTHILAIGVDVDGPNRPSTKKMTATSSATGSVVLSNVLLCVIEDRLWQNRNPNQPRDGADQDTVWNHR